MPRDVPVVVLTLLALSGCTEGGGHYGAPGEGTPTPAPPRDEGPPPAPVDASGGADTGPAVPDAGGGTCQSCSEELYPLEVGRRWDYVITRGARAGCDDGTVSTTVTGTGVDEDGSTYYRLEQSCGGYPSSEVKRGGDQLWIRSGGSADWYLFMQLPASEGAQWAAGGASGAVYGWSREGTVSVPAGTFEGCWRRSQIGYENWEVYCPGVGPVTQDFHQWQDEGYDLAGRSF